jgi:hypothetical protein
MLCQAERFVIYAGRSASIKLLAGEQYTHNGKVLTTQTASKNASGHNALQCNGPGAAAMQQDRNTQPMACTHTLQTYTTSTRHVCGCTDNCNHTNTLDGSVLCIRKAQPTQSQTRRAVSV